MSILDEREEYLKNPYFKEHEYGDFTPFYVTIAFCAVLGGFLFILNIVFCWCSRHREYWQNRHTGESNILVRLHLKIHRVAYSCVRAPLIQFLLFF